MLWVHNVSQNNRVHGQRLRLNKFFKRISRSSLGSLKPKYLLQTMATLPLPNKAAAYGPNLYVPVINNAKTRKIISIQLSNFFQLWILGWRPYCKLDCSGMSQVWGNTVYSAFFAVRRVEVHWTEHTYLKQVRFWRHRGIVAMHGSVLDPIYVRFSHRTIDNTATVELRTNKRSIKM